MLTVPNVMCTSCVDVVVTCGLVAMLRASYMEQNVRSSSLYRKYNEDVPLYLHNRPRRLIDDMRKKMRCVQADEVAGVRIQSPGVFQVPARGSRPPHEVIFGSETVCCSCSCQSFQRTQLLCIHFCAVFRAVPSWTFDHVSPIYTQSPLLTLDEGILAAGMSTTRTMDAVPSSPAVTTVNTEKLLKSERQKARTLLRDMFEMTFRVDDVTVLRRLVDSLQPVHHEMSECASPASSTRQPARTDSCKRKLQFKRYMLPACKKREVMSAGQVNRSSGRVNNEVMSAGQVTRSSGQVNQVTVSGGQVNISGGQVDHGVMSSGQVDHGVMSTGQVNVVEVHVIEGNDVEEEVTTASGPTFTV